MSSPRTNRRECRHDRPECQCRAITSELAFEHDFARVTQQIRAAHAFYEAGLEEEAAEWLREVINVCRGLRSALEPCDHRWKLDNTGALVCEEGCTG
jgi:hypothetical protein